MNSVIKMHYTHNKTRRFNPDFFLEETNVKFVFFKFKKK